MTQHRDVYLECDSCHTTFGETTMYGTAREARDNASDEGWTNDGGEDYCPECSGNAEGKA